jgi:DNA helicase IV
VLSTLQPDQYGLVRAPAQRALVVQGQPGTGKTIVATHRAAYLVHPEREGGPLARVGIVGPTEAWSRHVSSSIQQLGASNVLVFDLQAMLSDMSGVKWHQMQDGREDHLDTSWELGLFLAEAVPVLRVGHIGSLTVASTVKLLTSGDSRLEPLLEGRSEIRAWLRDAKDWPTMSAKRRYQPALAAIGQAVGRGSIGRLLDHLIVDEAQDVRPLEWQLLVRRMSASGSFTIVGDLNQRRSDWSYSTWEKLAQQLGVADDEGLVEIRVINTGYRSTRRILKFANQLLPKGQRTVDSLREGTHPVVEKTRGSEIEAEAVRRAVEYSERHAPGIVAVIAIAPKSISDRFRTLGWSRAVGLRDAWQKDGQTVMVLHPERARGLEFDAVVVVEPAQFPVNVGRIGSLYTSLTRATKELTVLHVKPLPKDLRPPR